MKRYKIYKGDNLQSLKMIPDNSIDSIVTDPPYALTSIKKRFGKEGSAPAQYGTDGAFQRASKGFMGKEWDAAVPTVEFWREVYRVLKPGGHILSFGGTRTYHRMAVNIEDAGFEIRDQIMWIYGSGFPKSLNIGKAVDKMEGNDRQVIGTKNDFALDGIVRNTDIHKPLKETLNADHTYGYKDGWNTPVTKGNSDWEGWGTALKPANEPICLARKPLSEKSVAENVLKWKTGGINIDGCRIGNETIMTNMKNTKGGLYNLGNQDRTNEVENTFNEGRFPANVILECCCDEVIKGETGEKTYKETNINNKEANWFRNNESDKEERWDYNDTGDIHTNPNCPCSIMDEQSGISKSNPRKKPLVSKREPTIYNTKEGGESSLSDKGGASRFFYNAKVSKAERNMGLDEFEEKKKEFETTTRTNKETADKFGCERKGTAKNTHPTVKPVALMSYLCRLITPENGIVLDPFMGSGSTGIAAQLEGFRFVGMEMDEEYLKIAEQRIESFEKYRKFQK